MKWLSRKLLVTVGSVLGTGAVAGVSDAVSATQWIELVLQWVIPAYLLMQGGPDMLKAWQADKRQPAKVA